MNRPAATDERAALRGHTCRFHVAGSGPPVLFIMGFGMSGDAWAPITDRVRPHARCIWYDVRGLGGSSVGRGGLTLPDLADDAAALLDHLGVPAAHVVGVSMGGMIAQHLALRHPHRLRTLSLIATHPGGGLGALLPPPRGAACFVGANLTTGATRLALLRRLLYVDPRNAAHAFQSDLAAIAASVSPLRVRLAHLRGILGHDTRADLGRIQAPTLVVKPLADVLVRPAASDILAQRIPHARLLEVPDGGHGVLVERASLVAGALVDHWRAPPPPVG